MSNAVPETSGGIACLLRKFELREPHDESTSARPRPTSLLHRKTPLLTLADKDADGTVPAVRPGAVGPKTKSKPRRPAPSAPTRSPPSDRSSSAAPKFDKPTMGVHVSDDVFLPDPKGTPLLKAGSEDSPNCQGGGTGDGQYGVPNKILSSERETKKNPTSANDPKRSPTTEWRNDASSDNELDRVRPEVDSTAAKAASAPPVFKRFGTTVPNGSVRAAVPANAKQVAVSRSTEDLLYSDPSPEPRTKDLAMFSCSDDRKTSAPSSSSSDMSPFSPLAVSSLAHSSGASNNSRPQAKKSPPPPVPKKKKVPTATLR